MALNQNDLTDFKFTDEQTKAFVQLKTKIKPEDFKDHTDRDLARFFESTFFDEEKTIAKVAAYMKWRSDKKIDNVLDKDYNNKALIETLVPHAYHGFDKEGRPIYFEKTGRIACGGLKHASVEDFVGSHIWGMEYFRQQSLPAASKTAGKYIDQFTTVIDASGLGMGHRSAISFLQACSQIDKDYYPGRVAKILLINTPWVFPVLFNLVSVFLDEQTKSRIFVLAGDAKTALSEHIPLAHIPSSYGGDCKCGNGKDCIPIQDATKYLGEVDDGLDAMNVAAGAKLQKELKCDGAGYTFSWFFNSVGDYDVDFSAVMETADGKKINLKMKSRCTTSKGSYESTGPCKVVFEWDNEFSYWNSKDIKYLLDCNKLATVPTAK